MNIIPSLYVHPLIILTYGLLFLSIFVLWLPVKHRMKYCLGTFTTAVICGVVANILTGYALLTIMLFALFIYISTFSMHKVYRIFAGCIVLILGFALKFHYAPGFHNLRILHNVLLTNDAIPYTFYINFDEACVGLLLLSLTHSLISCKRDWSIMLKQMLPAAAITIIIVGALSFVLGFIRFDPKLPEVTLIWTLTNLFIVCVAEEAYFRGFIQKNLALCLSKYTFGECIAIIIAAIIFGALHYPGGWKYIFLATVAGLGYGWVYSRTKRIEASIFTHFSLNLTQFLLFTYPALASAVMR